MTYRLLIVQPYVPWYRVPFFEALAERLAEVEIECIVAGPEKPSDQAARNDYVTGHHWQHITRGRALKVGPATLRSFGTARMLRTSNAVIAPLIGTCLDTHLAVAARLRGLRVGLWGHVGSYVQSANRLDVAVETTLMRAAHHVFAYTPQGATLAVDRGVAPRRVTTVMNTIDTDSLLRHMEAVQPEEIEEFSLQHHLQPGKTLAYLGGIDTSKRVDLLIGALDELWLRDPEVKVIVGGHGDATHLLTRAVGRRQVVRLGYARDREKALIAATAGALLNPGRIGLLAVDAMAMGLPIITTTDADHGPEVEYLRSSDLLVECPPDANKVADAAQRALKSPPPGAAKPPRIEEMVENFKHGIMRMIS